MGDEWDAVAEAWGSHADGLDRVTVPVRDRLIDRLELTGDETVLELAGGTGGLAQRLGPLAARVIYSDLSPAMVREAGSRIDRDNIDLRVLDMTSMELEDDVVDAIACQSGFMLVSEPLAALREARRVLRSGGRLVFSTWGPPDLNPWVLLPGAALLQHGHEIAHDPMGAGGIFSLAADDVLEDLVRSAGFGEVRTEPVTMAQHFDSFPAYWSLQSETAGPIAAVLAALPADEVATIEATCRTFCEAFETDSGYSFPATALVTVAR